MYDGHRVWGQNCWVNFKSSTLHRHAGLLPAYMLGDALVRKLAADALATAASVQVQYSIRNDGTCVNSHVSSA